MGDTPPSHRSDIAQTNRSNHYSHKTAPRLQKKKSREKAHFLFNRILYHQGCIFFHTFIFALSQHLCSCRRERIPKSTKAKRTISVRSHNKHISGTGAHVARRWKTRRFRELAIHLFAFDSGPHLSDAHMHIRYRSKVWVDWVISALTSIISSFTKWSIGMLSDCYKCMETSQDVLKTYRMALTVVALNVWLTMNIKCAIYGHLYRGWMLYNCYKI